MMVKFGAPAALAAVAALLGACDTVSSGPTQSIAVVERDDTPASQGEPGLAHRGHRAQSERSRRLQYPRRRLRPARPLRRRHRGLQQGCAARPGQRPRLHQPGARLPADQPQRRRARRFHPCRPGRRELRPGLYRPRQPPARRRATYSDALSDLSVAIRLSPEAAEGLHARGLVHQRQGGPPRPRSRTSTPRSTATRSSARPTPRAARASIAQNQYDKAVEDLNAALNVNNRDAESWAWRGVALERLGPPAGGGPGLPARRRRSSRATPPRSRGSDGSRAAWRACSAERAAADG